MLFSIQLLNVGRKDAIYKIIGTTFLGRLKICLQNVQVLDVVTLIVVITIGANSSPQKLASIGVASHISAAAQAGFVERGEMS